MSLATPEQLAEYELLTTRAGVVEGSGGTLIEVTGKDRATFLHSFCTNEVKKLQPGSGCEAFITSLQGKTLGHVFIAAEPERLLLAGVPGQAAVLLSHFDRYVISEDVAFRDLSADWAALLVVGPGTRDGVPGGVWREWPSLHLPAVWSVIDRGQLPLTLDTLAAAGIGLCSAEAFNMLRIECGYPVFGVDFGAETLPQELRRDAQAISFTKGCYLGQETIARIDALGHVNQVLSGVRFAADAHPALDEPLLAGEKVVGKLTSLAWSPKLHAPLGLAILRRGAAPAGAQLAWSGGHAQVVPLPVQ